jgi:hypothetical protein
VSARGFEKVRTELTEARSDGMTSCGSAGSCWNVMEYSEAPHTLSLTHSESLTHQGHHTRITILENHTLF